MPKISVIITTYNRPDYLSETLEAIYNQTYRDFEVILVDDGSKTNYADSYLDRYPDLVLIKKINGGLSAARNSGVEKSNGEWIAFCDDDDVWVHDKLERQVEAMSHDGEVGLIHGKIEMIDGNSKRLKPDYYKDGFYFFRRGNAFLKSIEVVLVKSPTPLIKKAVFEKTGGFNENIKVGEDVEFYMKAAYYTRFLYIDNVLAKYRVHNLGQLSHKKTEYLLITPYLMSFIKSIRREITLVLYFKALRGVARRHIWELNYNNKRLKFKDLIQLTGINPFLFFDFKSIQLIYRNLKTDINKLQ